LWPRLSKTRFARFGRLRLLVPLMICQTQAACQLVRFTSQRTEMDS
jgi:hypothetical protein